MRILVLELYTYGVFSYKYYVGHSCQRVLTLELIIGSLKAVTVVFFSIIPTNKPYEQNLLNIMTPLSTFFWLFLIVLDLAIHIFIEIHSVYW